MRFPHTEPIFRKASPHRCLALHGSGEEEAVAALVRTLAFTWELGGFFPLDAVFELVAH